MVLAVNIGSSSVKLGLFSPEDLSSADVTPAVWEKALDWSEVSGSRTDALRDFLKRVPEPSNVKAVGHRIVHGGNLYSAPVIIDAGVKQAIGNFAKFAPMHNPAGLLGIGAAEEVFPRARQVAVFDTAFHSTLPAEAAIYPGPYEWYEQGIRRYGFHGISHKYCAGRASGLLGRGIQELRLITCHLGSGCSLAAIRRGESIDTTMGLTPLDGLMMGTRSGSIDPGIIFYLLRDHAYTLDALDEILNHRSGLLGVSGVSSDMRRVLEAAAGGNARAELAIAAYVHRVRAQIGAMMAALDGVDALVFTGGVGENSSALRARICAQFECIGIEIDPAKNEAASGDGDIATSRFACRVLVVRAREEWAIARECSAV